MITASRLWDLADAAGQLCGGDADLVDVLIDARHVREEASAARALVGGLQHLIEEQRVQLGRQAEHIRDLERRELVATVAAYHAGVISEQEARTVLAPRVPNLAPGLGPMHRIRAPWLHVVRGALAALAVLVLGS